MALEAKVTVERYLRIAVLGENGEFQPLGFRCTTVGLLPEADLGLFHMPKTFLPKNSLQGLGFKCIKVTPLLLKSRDSISENLLLMIYVLNIRFHMLLGQLQILFQYEMLYFQGVVEDCFGGCAMQQNVTKFWKREWFLYGV